MLEQMIRFFTSAFHFPGLSPVLILVATAIGIVFGAIWLTPYWPSMINRPALWFVGVVSAFLTWTAIAFIQIPLQSWTGQALLHFWDQRTLTHWLLLAGNRRFFSAVSSKRGQVKHVSVFQEIALLVTA